MVLKKPKQPIWGFIGVRALFRSTKSGMDIGGGSSELAIGSGYELENAVSIDMGNVHLMEVFFNDNPPASLQISKAVEEIR